MMLRFEYWNYLMNNPEVLHWVLFGVGVVWVFAMACMAYRFFRRH